MKKTFKLTHEKTATPRLVEAIKHEVRKYVKRERKRALPADADFWDFDCRFGLDQTNSEEIHFGEIDQKINQAEADGLTSFYLEIIAKSAVRQHRSEKDDEQEEVEFDSQNEEPVN